MVKRIYFPFLDETRDMLHIAIKSRISIKRGQSNNDSYNDILIHSSSIKQSIYVILYNLINAVSKKVLLK